MESVYPGESCRSARERGAEHLSAYRKNHKDSIMFKHYCEHHGRGPERPEFGMKVLRYHTSATTRQVHEAVVIWQRSRGVKKGEMRILNSKSMFNRCKLRRLVIEDSHEKDEVAKGNNENVRNGDKEQEDVGTSDNIPDSRKDSSMTTSRGRASYNKRAQQNLTKYYKFRGKNN